MRTDVVMEYFLEEINSKRLEIKKSKMRTILERFFFARKVYLASTLAVFTSLAFVFGYFYSAPFFHIEDMRQLIDVINKDKRFEELKHLLSINDFIIENLFRYSAPLFLTYGFASSIIYFVKKAFPGLIIESNKGDNEEDSDEEINNTLDAEKKSQAYDFANTMVKIVGKGFYPTSVFMVVLGGGSFGTLLNLAFLQYEEAVNSGLNNFGWLNSFYISMGSSFALIVIGFFAFFKIRFDAKKASLRSAFGAFIIFFLMVSYNGWKNIEEKVNYYKLAKRLNTELTKK